MLIDLSLSLFYSLLLSSPHLFLLPSPSQCYVYTRIEFQLSIARMYSRASPRILLSYLFSNWKNIQASTTRDLFLKDTNTVVETRYGSAVLSKILDFGCPRDLEKRASKNLQFVREWK